MSLASGVEDDRRSSDLATIPTFATSVAAVGRINEGLLEVELAGGLDDFVSLGGDQFFYMMMPRPGTAQLPDGYAMADYMEQTDDERPIGAYYTVRRWVQERGRMTVWVVLHGHRTGAGGWFEQCSVGDRVVIWGPRHSFSPPATAREQLLVADETGFAAVAALLDESPADRHSTVILETIDEHHTIDLSGHANARVRWVYRGDAEPGTGSGLLEAIRDLELDVDGLIAFGAAESRQISAVRSYLRHDVGLPAERVFLTGYWRRDIARSA